MKKYIALALLGLAVTVSGDAHESSLNCQKGLTDTCGWDMTADDAGEPPASTFCTADCKAIAGGDDCKDLVKVAVDNGEDQATMDAFLGEMTAYDFYCQCYSAIKDKCDSGRRHLLNDTPSKECCTAILDAGCDTVTVPAMMDEDGTISNGIKHCVDNKDDGDKDDGDKDGASKLAAFGAAAAAAVACTAALV
mmetsp:Transcript_40117/g.48603  ORF Transcript_40117/g.48603 Transcript_40117/m.48603 type:complete len:193 (-) Transcript_40117:165-743(-)|eukprot:CAMPEP_0197857658 /NCGR_PEP_ID=MMETSP1438-20131217/30965_1 /TAXON_ID=1461541 /ORGANISM="Pterosperma sp., Strain CCMP1384" /LENGTH=192 /DNA_ID=CAMNT_0043473573 /DNA_START=73 /DNA_END=651 /DNA_ORIENTATION=+